MTTTDTHDQEIYLYDAIQAAQIEAARILTEESEINVRCDHDRYLSISMTPLRDGEIPRDGEYFSWGVGFHSSVGIPELPYAPAEEWFGMHMVPVEDQDDAMYCCSLGTGLDCRSTDPRAIARALERGYRDFCARRAAGDHHPDEYPSLND